MKAKENLEKTLSQNLEFVTNNQKSIENARERLKLKEIEFQEFNEIYKPEWIKLEEVYKGLLERQKENN